MAWYCMFLQQGGRHIAPPMVHKLVIFYTLSSQAQMKLFKMQRQIRSKRMALVIRLTLFLVTNNTKKYCFHWRVDGLVLHFCLSHIRVPEIASPMAHTIAFPTPLNLNTQMQLFKMTKRKQSYPKWWLWS